MKKNDFEYMCMNISFMNPSMWKRCFGRQLYTLIYTSAHVTSAVLSLCFKLIMRPGHLAAGLWLWPNG